MSNQVALFTNNTNVALPEHLRGIQVDEQTKALAGGAGGLRISIKGGVWRLLNNGQEIMKNDDRHLNVVIVRSSPDNARNFYAEAYVEGEDPKPPTCWSSNGVVPDAQVKPENKQSPTCNGCPQNIAGSGQGQSRACRYSRALAVVLEGDLGGKIFKVQLPATSLFGNIENNVMPLQAYGKLLVQHNLPINAVVTEMRFDTNSATPKVGFKGVRYLTAEEWEIAKTQGEAPEAIAACATTVFQQDQAGADPLGIPGAPPAGAAGTQTATTSVNVPAATAEAPGAADPVVIETPATTAATAPATPAKRTRTKPAAAPAPAAPPAPAQPIKRMTDAAGEFTYDQYKEIGWSDEDLVKEGFMVIEQPAPPAAPAKPPAPKAPPKPAAPPSPVAQAAQAAAAVAEHVDAEPVVVVKPPSPQAQQVAEANIVGAAAALAGWDKEDE